MSKKKKAESEVQGAVSVPTEMTVCLEEKSAVSAPSLPCENSGELTVSVECSESVGDVAAGVDVTNPGELVGELVDVGESNGAEGVLGVGQESVCDTGEPVEPQKRKRRSNGSGSIWQSSNGKTGICVQLGKSPDGKKLRHVQYYQTRAEAEEGLLEYLENIDKLRAKKLEKLVK